MLVPESFMIDVCRLVEIIYGQEKTEDFEPVLQRIQAVIQAKCDARERRRLYTEYKTAKIGTAQREVARQNYLDETGIHKNWRTEKEIPFH